MNKSINFKRIATLLIAFVMIVSLFSFCSVKSYAATLTTVPNAQVGVPPNTFQCTLAQYSINLYRNTKIVSYAGRFYGKISSASYRLTENKSLTNKNWYIKIYSVRLTAGCNGIAMDNTGKQINNPIYQGESNSISKTIPSSFTTNTGTVTTNMKYYHMFERGLPAQRHGTSLLIKFKYINRNDNRYHYCLVANDFQGAFRVTGDSQDELDMQMNY